MPIEVVLHSRINTVHYVAGVPGWPFEVSLTEFEIYLAMVNPNEGYRDAIAFDFEYATLSAPLLVPVIG